MDMKIAVFGGAGLTGSATIDLAVQRGHQIRALVRETTPAPRPRENVDIVRGDALDPRAVEDTILGADVVVSSLGGFRGPESMAAGTENIIATMRRSGPQRLVVLQGFHIDFPGDPHNLGKKFVKAYLALRCRPILEHSARLGRMLQQTDDVAWTLVRVPPILDKPATGRAQFGRFALGPMSSVTVGDAATAVLDLAGTTEWLHDAPMLVTPRREGAKEKARVEPTSSS